MTALDVFEPTKLPEPYLWALGHATKFGPNVMREALKCHGIKELRGSKHSDEIMAMADYLGGVLDDFYTADEIPWCGLFVGYALKKAGFEPPKNYSVVRARDYSSWGIPAPEPSFGDVMVFWRGKKQGRNGHVALYVSEDPHAYHVLGGNQNNSVNITRISKERLLAARRCPWRIQQPYGVKPFRISAARGLLSKNEA